MKMPSVSVYFNYKLSFFLLRRNKTYAMTFYILHSLFSARAGILDRRVLSNGIRMGKMWRGCISLSVQDFQIWRSICKEKMGTFVKYSRIFSFLTQNRYNSILHIWPLKFWCNTKSNIRNRCILPTRFVSCDSQDKKDSGK
jgi:hypothetical protein